MPANRTPHSEHAGEPTLDAAQGDRLRRATGAAHELSELIWEALREELEVRSTGAPRARHVAELSERLAEVASTVSLLAAAAAREPDASVSEPPVLPPSALETPIVAAPEADGPVTASAGPVSPRAHGSLPDPPPHVDRPFEHAPGPRPAVIIIDERNDPPTVSAPAGRSEPAHTGRSEPAHTGRSEPAYASRSEPAYASRSEPAHTGVSGPASSGRSEPASDGPSEPARTEAAGSDPRVPPRSHTSVTPRPLPWDMPLSDELRVTRGGDAPLSPPRRRP